MTYLIRHATLEDLPRIVDIYNASIPGRMATADLHPISMESRMAWFQEHHSGDRPLFVYVDRSESTSAGDLLGWISLSSFYGRPAYQNTTEVSLYVAPKAQGHGIGSLLLKSLIEHCEPLPVRVLLGFIFGHNQPSLHLFNKFGFEKWGSLPRIAVLDGIERDLVIVGKHLK